MTDMVKCKNCGTSLTDTTKCCSECGTLIEEDVSQTNTSTNKNDNIDKIIDDWFDDLVNKGDTCFQDKNLVMAIRYYKQALRLYPNAANIKAKLQQAKNQIRNKLKDICKKVLYIIGIVFLLIFTVDKCQDYIEERERIAELERVSVPAQKDILLRIDEICKDITEGNYYNKHFVKDLKDRMDRTDALLRRYDLYMRFLEQNDIWTNSGVCEIVTAKKSNFQMITPTSAMIDVQFIDSRYGELAARKIEFCYEDGSWMVSDIKSFDDSFSLRRYSYNFVNWVEREYE